MMDFYNFSAGVIVGDYLYFSSIMINALYRRNIYSHVVEYLGYFPYENLKQQYLHKKCILWNERIVFLPCSSHYIHIFNINTSNFNEIAFKPETDEHDCADGVLHGEDLYIFPYNLSRPLIKIDLLNETVDEIWAFSEWCKKNIKMVDIDCVFARNVCINDKIYMNVYGGNSIVIYDCNSDNYEARNIQIDGIFSLFRCNYSNWIVTLQGEYIYKMDDDWRIVKEKYKCPTTIGIFKRKYNEMLNLGKNVYVLPAESNRILKFDDDSKSFVLWKDYPDGFKFYSGEKMKFYRYDIANGKAYLFSRNSNSVLIIDEIEDELKIAWDNGFQMNEYWNNNIEHLTDILLSENDEGRILKEGVPVKLSLFLESVADLRRKRYV